jgi:hypothetical protein
MAAWMDAWWRHGVFSQEGRREECMPGPATQARCEGRQPLPGILHVQVAEILAGIAWTVLRG